MENAPSSGPTRPPRPPTRGVPPSTTAAIATRVYSVELDALAEFTRPVRARPPDPGEQAAEPVGRHSHRVDVDAAGKGRRVVASDRVQQPPERDQPQAEPDEQGQPDGEHAAGDRPDRPGQMLDPSAVADRDRVRRDEQ